MRLVEAARAARSIAELADSPDFEAKAVILGCRATNDIVGGPRPEISPSIPRQPRGRMTAALQRGSVVLCRGQYGVVWLAQGAELVLHPVTAPQAQARAGDIELSLPELIGAGIELARGCVRCSHPVRVAAEGQTWVGTLAGPVVCRISLAAARAYAAAEAEHRWGAERRHRQEARSQHPVRLVGEP